MCGNAAKSRARPVGASHAIVQASSLHSRLHVRAPGTLGCEALFFGSVPSMKPSAPAFASLSLTALLAQVVLFPCGVIAQDMAPTIELSPPIDRYISAQDAAGRAIAVNGRDALIGVPGDDIQAANQGSVYALRRSDVDGEWRVVQRIVAPVPSASASFGEAIAFDGVQTVIGAPGDNAAHVFRLSPDSSTWHYEASLAPPEMPGVVHVGFGISVSISGDSIVVGTGRPNVAPGAVFGGGAHAFRRVGDVWAHEDVLGNTGGGGVIGSSASRVSLSVNPVNASVTAAVRRPNSEIPVDPAGNSFVRQAIVEIYRRQANGLWLYVQRVTKPNASMASDAGRTRFGESLAMRGEWLVIGSPDGCSAPAGCGAVQLYRASSSAGGVYQATQQLAIIGSDFGASVALDPMLNQLAVGSGVGGSSATVATYSTDSSGVWNPVASLPVADSHDEDGHGRALAIEGRTLLIGAPGFDSNNDVAAGRVVFHTHSGDGLWSASAQTLDLVEPPQLDRFGHSLSAAEDLLYIGAPWDTVRDGLERAGTVSIRTCDENECRPVARLTSPLATRDGFFGSAVAVDRITGALAVSQTGGEPRVFLYQRVGVTSWELRQTLSAPAGSGMEQGFFGSVLAFHDGWLAVAAPFGPANRTSPPRVAAYRPNSSATSVGLVEAVPLLLQGPTLLGPNLQFGIALEFGAWPTSTLPTLFVGAPRARGFVDGTVVETGAVYRFRLEGNGILAPNDVLVSPVPEAGSRFGQSLSSALAGGPMLFVGAPGGRTSPPPLGGETQSRVLGFQVLNGDAGPAAYPLIISQRPSPGSSACVGYGSKVEAESESDNVERIIVATDATSTATCPLFQRVMDELPLEDQYPLFAPWVQDGAATGHDLVMSGQRWVASSAPEFMGPEPGSSIGRVVVQPFLPTRVVRAEPLSAPIVGRATAIRIAGIIDSPQVLPTYRSGLFVRFSAGSCTAFSEPMGSGGAFEGECTLTPLFAGEQVLSVQGAATPAHRRPAAFFRTEGVVLQEERVFSNGFE